MKKNKITLATFTEVSFDSLTDREKSVFEAGRQDGFKEAKLFVLIFFFLTLITVVGVCLYHNYTQHGTLYKSYLSLIPSRYRISEGYKI